MQTGDPLNARFWFNLRPAVNWVISIAVFAVLVFVLQNFMHPLMADVIALCVAFCLLFFVLDKRSIGIVCPHPDCNEYIETNTSWVCGFCKQKNVQTDDFPFINRCEHKDCGQEPKAYQCHHCEELIFFTKDKLKINYAVCANLPVKNKSTPARKDPIARKLSEQNEAIRETEYKLRKAKLDLELKGVKEYLDPKKDRTQEEILEESARNFKDRNMSGPRIVARMKAENAEKFKDNPPELERQNRLVDQWALNHLDDL